MKYILIAYLVTAAFCVAAAADEVNLTNGRTLVGIARNEEPNRVVVETRFGELRFPRNEVQSIKTGRSDLHEYKERLDAIGACPSAAQLFELAQWAQDRGLTCHINGLLTQVIELEPDHAEARSLLGYVKYDGNWMFPADRDAIRRAREAQHRTVAKKTVPVRRTTRPVEETPYSLGLPLMPNRSTTDVYPPRSAYNSGGYSSGGYGDGVLIGIGLGFGAGGVSPFTGTGLRATGATTGNFMRSVPVSGGGSAFPTNAATGSVPGGTANPATQPGSAPLQGGTFKSR